MLHPEDASHLETLVEYPLLDAAKDLLDKGIESFSSSANKKDVVGGEIYLTLYYDSLNEKNREASKQLFEVYEQQFHKKVKLVKISIPVGSETTVGEIRRKFKEITDLFEDQTTDTPA